MTCGVKMVMDKEQPAANKEQEQVDNTWEHLGVSENLLRGIYGSGFESPSPIQRQAIPPILLGRDLLAQAQSGTGKTAAFVIGSLFQMEKQRLSALILTPTRELTHQISSVAVSLSRHLENVSVISLVGGVSVSENVRQLQTCAAQRKWMLMVGCPGRVNDLIRRRCIYPQQWCIATLDEADEMLTPEFKDQVYSIFRVLSEEAQIALFSATLPQHVITMTEKWMRNPVQITVEVDKLSLQGIRQYYVELQNDDEKLDALKDLYRDLSISQCVIYCNSVGRVERLYKHLEMNGFPVCHMHSNMSAEERESSFLQFKRGETRVLISTDITARGIDIQQVSVVINFDIPTNVHVYLHRIGRSGRWGRKGVGINFVTQYDSRMLAAISKHYATTIEHLPASFVTL